MTEDGRLDLKAQIDELLAATRAIHEQQWVRDDARTARRRETELQQQVVALLDQLAGCYPPNNDVIDWALAARERLAELEAAVS